MGLFHVEQSYLDLMGEFQQNLRQRNAAIRQGSAEEVRIWNHPLATVGEVLNAHRTRFVEELLNRTEEIHSGWQPDFALSYRYRNGWGKDKDLLEELESKIDVDIRMGYTTRGPQRAELEILADGGSAEKRLSRGQQKLVVLAMNLALVDSLAAHQRSLPIVLIDDLSAELDKQNRERIMAELEIRGGQVFLTMIEAHALQVENSESKTFHVEHGALVS